jgi:hypothetical protein
VQTMGPTRLVTSLARGVRDLWDLIRHGLDFDIDLTDIQLVADPPPIGPAQVSVGGVFARYHARAYGDPARLHSLFLDTAGKLNASERFARAGLHCGHFFAAAAGGALEEARYCGIDLSDRFLLEVDIEIPDILDLTNQDTLRDAIAAASDPAEEMAVRPYTQSLRVVVDQTTGGNPITDAVGAERSGAATGASASSPRAP